MESDPQTGVLDAEILDAALELEEGVEPDLDALHGRFPDRPDGVRAVVRALRSYRDQVRLERSSKTDQDHGGLLATGTVLGEYRIDGLLGSGGMGVVYRATQLSDGLAVAVKVLRPEVVHRDRNALGRFHREAELLAGVAHPNLARTLGSCVEEDRVYFAMELAEGRSLGEVLQRLALVRRLGDDRHERPDYVRSVVLLVSKVARALAAIHERGLIHRDVKPSNIILRGAGDDDLQALTREPVLVDNGLLRPAEESDLTSSQTLLGTPAFVSPEARLGRELDARSDVFSLGVVLYDLLTLTAPGRRRIASSGLCEVSKVTPAVDRRLSAIVARAMEDRRGLRYADGAAFERELTRYLEGRSIRALPGNPVRRLWLVARRRPTQAALGGSILAVVLAGLVVLAWGEVGRALRLRSLVREAERLEQAGELHGAWQAWSALPSQAGILDALLGTGRDLARAQRYWGGEFGSVCSRLDPTSPDTSEDGHEDLRRFLLSEADGEHVETSIRYLVHELREGDQQRVRSSAKTAAIYLMTRPQGWGQTLTGGEFDGRLEGALSGLASGEVQMAPSQEARYYATAALSGLPRSSTFQTLIPLLVDQDAEVRRVATAGLLRQCHLAWRDGQEGQVTAALLDRWLTALADSMRQHKETVNVGGAYQNSLHAIVDTYLALEESPTRALVPDTDLARYLERLTLAHGEADDGGDPTVERWKDIGDDKPIVRVRARRKGTVGRSSDFETYENLWAREPEEGEIGPFLADPEARVFSFSLSEVSGPSFEASPGHSPMGSVRWSGTALDLPKGDPPDRGCGQLEMADPFGRSEVTLTCPIPESVGSARVTIVHEKSARWFLPYRGEARIEISVWENDPVLVRSVPFEVEEVGFTIHRQVLERSDELAITVRFVSGTTAYWLREVVVEFETKGQ